MPCHHPRGSLGLACHTRRTRHKVPHMRRCIWRGQARHWCKASMMQRSCSTRSERSINHVRRYETVLFDDGCARSPLTPLITGGRTDYDRCPALSCELASKRSSSSRLVPPGARQPLIRRSGPVRCRATAAAAWQWLEGSMMVGKQQQQQIVTMASAVVQFHWRQ